MKNLKGNKHQSADSNTDKTTILKKLKIVNKPYKNTYVVGLNLQGKYLSEFGFEYGDIVNVSISKNRITIENTPKH